MYVPRKAASVLHLSAFLMLCGKLGVSSHDTFVTSDVVDGRNTAQVIFEGKQQICPAAAELPCACGVARTLEQYHHFDFRTREDVAQVCRDVGSVRWAAGAATRHCPAGKNVVRLTV